MATILEICQNVAHNIGLEVPESITNTFIGGFGDLLRVEANRAGKALARKQGPNFESWKVLTKVFTFLTVNNEVQYELPEDYYRLLEDTVWDRSEQRQAYGPLTPGEWQRQKSGIISYSRISPIYRIIGLENGRKAFVFDYPPGNNQELVLEYTSTNWLRESEGQTLSLNSIDADTNVPAFPDDLLELEIIWRVKKARGEDFLADMAEASTLFDEVFYSDVGHQIVSAYSTDEDRGYGRPNVPDSGFGTPSTPEVPVTPSVPVTPAEAMYQVTYGLTSNGSVFAESTVLDVTGNTFGLTFPASQTSFRSWYFTLPNTRTVSQVINTALGSVDITSHWTQQGTTQTWWYTGPQYDAGTIYNARITTRESS